MPTASVVVDADVAYWRARAEAAEARAEELRARVGELGEQVAVLSRMLFGRSSEKSGSSSGADEGPEARAGSGGQPGKRGQRPGSRGHGRRDYSRLDTREEVHDVAAGERVCAGCGAVFEPWGSEDSEQVDWRVTVTRIVHRRRRYRRRCGCAGPRTVTAPVPVRPVAKGRFTAGFLARLLYKKYVLGLPLHRIVRSLAAEGLDVAEGTLSGALKDVHALLAPLETAVAERNAAAFHVHADETGWRVFERVEGKDGTRWWLWVFGAADTVVFRMDPTRSAAVVEKHFGIDREAAALPGGRRLVLSSDFFTVYQSLARVDGVDSLWCWAHVRRYFVRAGDAHAQLRYWRDGWVERIALLYVAHRDLAAAEPGTDAHRQAGEAFEAALTDMDTARREQAGVHSLHPAAKKVLATLDREWEGLARHRDFPDLPLDNNRRKGRCGTRWSAGRTTTARRPNGPPEFPL
ncbi:IS66 family transposase [Frankia sp. AiPa1]|uniref:IS66 family transposase n=1 Tax=Frankia sp. AiPa1 TaxID=573492 RepID=UPI00202AF03B|nr:IS66 family transposase [Frankia sp. AiPa1]MCL9758134.1 IS66 family transposase [Frankia sp. AiPa1]